MTRNHLSFPSSVHDVRHLALKHWPFCPCHWLWVGTRRGLAVGIVAVVHSWELRDAPYKTFGNSVPTKELALVSWYHCCHRIKGKGVAVRTTCLLLQGLAKDKVQAAMLKWKYGAMRQEDATFSYPSNVRPGLL